MSLTDYKLLSEVMPGTLIESPGSIVDEVWASTSRESSAIVINFNYQGLDILSSPFKQMNYYNLHTLWRKAERLVHDIKVFSMRPLMLKHDFFIMIVYITINEERIIVFYGRAIRAIRDTLSVTCFRLSQNSERR